MLAISSRQKSVYVYHLHMGGPDVDALEWRSLRSPRFAPRLEQAGITHVYSPAEADVIIITGLLLVRNLDAVLAELARVSSPAVLVAAGDAAINGGPWARLNMPHLALYPIGHYADVQVTVPGDPPTPQALIAALAAASEILSRPGDRLSAWQDD
jgi:Ni,Fe-hydrogenase III small subunit